MDEPNILALRSGCEREAGDYEIGETLILYPPRLSDTAGPEISTFRGWW